MVSDSEPDSDPDSPFTDCHVPSGTDSATGGRKRQISMPEMVRQAQTKRAKRPSHGRHSHSPRDAAPGGRPQSGESAADRQPAVTLDAIQRLIEAGNRNVIAAFDAKFAQLSKRLDIVESECVEKDFEIKRLKASVAAQEKENTELRERLEGIDLNRRLSSLILTSDDFGPRTPNEDIEERTVQVLNSRFPDLKLTTADLQVAHRLQTENKVIVKFGKRRVRDTVFERRFDLFGRRPGPSGGGAGAGRGSAALYINESLTPKNQHIFNSLLQARRSNSGAKISSVFSRRGFVFCKKEKNGPNIPVRDLQQLRRVLGDDGCPPRRGDAEAAPPRGRRLGPTVGGDADSAPPAPLPAGPSSVVPPGEPTSVTVHRDGVSTGRLGPADRVNAGAGAMESLDGCSGGVSL